MSEGVVEVVLEPPLAVVTLARPAKLNALSGAMLDGLDAAAERLDAATEVRAVLLTGAGERAFCGGADIAEWSGLGPHAFGRDWVRRGHRLFDRWAGLRPPVLAVLNGLALGGGLELAATADLRIAEAHARLGLPEARLGVIPGWSGTQRLVRRAGGTAVRRLVLLGEPVDAAEALRLGLVDYLCPTGAGLAFARELALRIAERAPLAVQMAKQLINAAEGEAGAATLEALAGALAAGTQDVAAGIAAFQGKTQARFEGR
jgi:enoyl-CoA hydratase/carnithine racemase